MTFPTDLPRDNFVEADPTRVFPVIRLGDTGPVDSATIERHFLVIGDPHVRGLALQCVGALRKQIEIAAFPSFMSLAAEAAKADGITPAEWLEQKLAAIRAETDQTKIEHALLEARRKARANRLNPLKFAVSARLDSALREIESLQQKVRSFEYQPIGPQPSQYQKLFEAGLKPAQIAGLGVDDPAEKITAQIVEAKDRIAALAAQIPALRAFSNDPRQNPSHLRGLDGFDALIAAAQNISEEGDHRAKC